MHIALVHDWLLSPFGGSEQVLSAMHSLFGAPPIYTLLWDAKAFADTSLSNAEVHPSSLKKMPWIKKKWRAYLPFFPLTIERFNLSQYDLILSSSHCVAKGILSTPDQLHICYCHTPMRYAWDLSHDYLHTARWPTRLLMHYLRSWDVHSAHRVDRFIANSHFVKRRIYKTYGRDAHVIYPPVNTTYFSLGEAKEDFYLVASRLVSYKKVDLIIEAFNQMPRKKLIVIGDGPEAKRIKAKLTSNIEFLGAVSSDQLRFYLQRARALLFPPIEDFGILPVEAMASGTPVLALKKGGAVETVRENETGLFFDEQSVAAVREVIERFERIPSWNPQRIRAHALSFDSSQFSQQLRLFVDAAYHDHKNALTYSPLVIPKDSLP